MGSKPTPQKDSILLMSDCGNCSKEKSKLLADQSAVCTDCEQWRTECEAAALLRLPLQSRRQMLDERVKKRGEKSVEVLKQAMKRLHEKKAGTSPAQLTTQEETTKQ